MIWACTKEGYGLQREIVLWMQQPGRRKRGIPRMKYMVVREDMEAVGVTGEDVEDRGSGGGGGMIRCDDT